MQSSIVQEEQRPQFNLGAVAKLVREHVRASRQGTLTKPKIGASTTVFDPAPTSPRRKTASNKSKAALQCALPGSLAPRGLSREQAAAYIGVSSTKFVQLVSDELMPQPKIIGTRRVWDRLALDAAFSALPDANGDVEYPDDIWSRASL